MIKTEIDAGKVQMLKLSESTPSTVN